MKVKELIEQLASHNQDAEIFVYSQIDEGGDETNELLSSEDAKGKLYFKGDAPWDEDDNNFVVIA